MWRSADSLENHEQLSITQHAASYALAICPCYLEHQLTISRTELCTIQLILHFVCFTAKNTVEESSALISGVKSPKASQDISLKGTKGYKFLI